MNDSIRRLIREVAEEDARQLYFGRRKNIGEPKNELQRAYAETFDKLTKDYVPPPPMPFSRGRDLSGRKESFS